MNPSAAREAVTGAEYVQHITRFESDRRARAAFQDLVLQIAAPGAALFDFGAGTGIDARFFAERSFTIQAYDVDQRMCEYFAAHCRDFIDSGRVVLEGGAFTEFLARNTDGAVGRIDLVISNFAPLSLVEDLPELFAKFHRLTAPNGKLLLSVLSPYFIGDMRYPWWWRSLPLLLRDGHYSTSGPNVRVNRRRIANIAELSSPYFRLVDVFRGLPSHKVKPSSAVHPGGVARWTWLRVATSRFMFLLFEKQD